MNDQIEKCNVTRVAFFFDQTSISILGSSEPTPTTNKTGTLEYGRTQKGGLLAIAGGHAHVKNGVSKRDPSITFWHCVDKRRFGCNGKIHSVGDQYEVIDEHCHDSTSQQALVKALKAKENIRNGALVCDDISKLVNDNYDFLRTDEKALLSKKSTLHRIARNRKNKGNTIKLPKEPEELVDLGKFQSSFRVF